MSAFFAHDSFFPHDAAFTSDDAAFLSGNTPWDPQYFAPCGNGGDNGGLEGSAGCNPASLAVPGESSLQFGETADSYDDSSADASCDTAGANTSTGSSGSVSLTPGAAAPGQDHGNQAEPVKSEELVLDTDAPEAGDVADDNAEGAASSGDNGAALTVPDGSRPKRSTPCPAALASSLARPSKTPRHARKAAKGKSKRDVTLAQLVAVAHLPFNAAAERLSMSQTYLKSYKIKHKVDHWPARQIQDLCSRLDMEHADFAKQFPDKIVTMMREHTSVKKKRKTNSCK